MPIDKYQLEKQAKPIGETIFIKATAAQTNIYYACQRFYYEDHFHVFFAVRIRALGEVSVLPKTGKTILREPLPKYREYHAQMNAFHCIVNLSNKSISFGPGDNIRVVMPEHQNKGLGSYAFSKAVEFAKTYYADYRIQPGCLSSVDALEGDDNYYVREHFYTGQGFNVVYSDDGCSGHFGVNQCAGDLVPRWNPDKITESRDLFSDLVDALNSIKHLEDANRGLAKLIDSHERENQKLREYKKTATLIIAFLLSGAFLWELLMN